MKYLIFIIAIVAMSACLSTSQEPSNTETAIDTIKVDTAIVDTLLLND